MVFCHTCGSQFHLKTKISVRPEWYHLSCKRCLLQLADNIEEEPLPELPDGVLLEVFQWLPVRDLLCGVRAVCRRWRALALHPSLWSCRSLWLRVEPSDEAKATLMTAPCLRFLGLDQYNKLPSQTVNAVCRTSCALSKLSITFPRLEAPETEDINKAKLLRIFGRQGDLGRLKSLTFHYVPRKIAKDLIKMVLLTLDLSVLEVGIISEGSGKGIDGVPFGSPLNRNLKCPYLESLKYSSTTKDKLLENLISAHCATLDSLTIDSVMSSRTVELLGTCHRLRQLSVEKSAVMLARADFKALTLLTDLTLHLPHRDSVEVPQLDSFFSGTCATRLTSLCLLVEPFMDYKVDCGIVDLLKALGSTGRSALKQLRVSYIEDPSETLLRLPDVLPSLLQLYSLHIYDMLPKAVVDSISPSTAPSLRLICFHGLLEWTDTCLPARCCFPCFYSLLRRYKQMHIVGLPSCHDCDDEVCDCCARDLHPLNTSDYIDYCGLHGHSDSEECDIEDRGTKLDKQCCGNLLECKYVF